LNRAQKISTSLTVAALIAGLSLAAARAATQTTTFQVTATVAATCNINSAGNLDFGAYPGTQTDNTSTITVTCTNTTPYDLGLNAGTSVGATVTTRAMTGPASALLHYALFRDSARTLNWGDTVGTDTLHVVANGTAQGSTVFGRVPGAQAPQPGSYTDTITVTLTF
jgi:spore coat protein U-like protein